MSLKRLILLLSALLVFSPVMSSFAMPSQMNSVYHDAIQQEAGITQQHSVLGNNCMCHNPGEPVTCQDSGCQCDACASIMYILGYALTSPDLYSTDNDTVSQDATDTTISILVPPPITLL